MREILSDGQKFRGKIRGLRRKTATVQLHGRHDCTIFVYTESQRSPIKPLFRSDIATEVSAERNSSPNCNMYAHSNSIYTELRIVICIIATSMSFSRIVFTTGERHQRASRRGFH